MLTHDQSQHELCRPFAGMSVFADSVSLHKKGCFPLIFAVMKMRDYSAQLLIRFRCRERQCVIVNIKFPLFFKILFFVRCKQQYGFPYNCRFKHNARIIGNKHIAGRHKLLAVIIPAHVNNRTVSAFPVSSARKRRMPSEQNLPFSSKALLQAISKPDKVQSLHRGFFLFFLIVAKSRGVQYRVCISIYLVFRIHFIPVIRME